MAWYYIVLIAAYLGTIISLVAVVLSENRNPVKSLAWITVLLTVPVFGFILYIFFGRSLKNTRMITRCNRRRLRRRGANKQHIDPGKTSLSPQSCQVARMVHTMAGVPLYEGGSIDVFTNGNEKFNSLFADLSAAKRYILLQYYIIDDDKTGNRLADLLIERASQGVSVRIIYDHIGSINTKNTFFKRMSEAGIEVFPFFRVNFPLFATRINWRNHRKIVVIDGNIGYIGGMNVADRYVSTWRDTHLRITGPAVAGLQYAFAVDWSFMGRPLISDEPLPMPKSETPYYMQLLTSGPTSQWSNIAMAYTEAIGKATDRVYIQTPYFLPTDTLLRVLQSAALSKVDVRIMIPAKSDSRILTLASASYIEECLRAGIKIYLYQPGMLHAKTVIIDDEIVSVGSTNFDFRSFEHNFESNAFIYSKDVNALLSKIFMSDQSQCCRVNAAEWKRRPRLQKTKESLTRLLSPVL